MQKYSQLEVPAEQYEKIKTTQVLNGSKFNEHSFGSRKNLYVNGTLIASAAVASSLDLGEISNNQFVAFLGAFNRHLYAQLMAKPELFQLKIDFNALSRDKNIPLWNQIPVGTHFFNVDLSSAYWQIAHRLGYISTPFFERYQQLDSHKQAKRYCISFLARENSMKYSSGQQIYCDIRPLQRVYDNIRNELYFCVQKCLHGLENWLEYNIDGVSVLAADVPEVKRRLKELNLQFKISQCTKESSTQYTYKGTSRKFTGKLLELA